MSRFERHVFVCTNSRPQGGKPSCGERGGFEVCAALEQALAARPALWGKIAVTASGCLGPCWDGPNAVVYPDGIRYAGLTTADVAEVADAHLVGGVPVDRLLYRWE